MCTVLLPPGSNPIAVKYIIYLIIKVMVFWDVKPCNFMNIFGSLGGTCFFHLQGDPCHASSHSFCIPVVTCIFFLLPYAYFSWIFWSASFLLKSPIRRFLYALSYFGLFKWFWLSYLWEVYSTRTRFYPDWDIFHVPSSMSLDVPHWNFFDAPVRLIQL